MADTTAMQRLVILNRCGLISALLLLCFAGPAWAQILQGEWVDQSQAEIEQHRMTGATVVVLDADDRPVQGD